jgi:flagellar biosynthesis/type III secretory pathway chaperone
MSALFEMKNKAPESRSAPEFVLAREPGKAMQEMMDIIDNLHGIIDAETRALEKADTKTFFGLQEKKIVAAQAYHDGATQLIQRKDEFSGVRRDFKKMLEKKQEDFNKSTEVNLKKLKSMSRGIQRLSSCLMESAREQGEKEQSVNYSSDGKVKKNVAKKVSIGVIESA